MDVLSSRVLLRPSDFAATRAFYADVVGLAIYREYSSAGRVVGTVFFLGGGFLEITSTGSQQPSGHVVLWLQVRDLAAEHARLAAAGATVLAAPEKKPWGLLEMSIEDPDGLELIVVEVPDGHPLRSA